MASPASRRGGSSRGTSSLGSASHNNTVSAAPSLAQALWQRRVSVLIAHAALGGFYDNSHESDSRTKPPTSPLFAASVPRFGYLAQLLPRLTSFFGQPCSSFQCEDVPLRNLPAGLLADLYRPPTMAQGPWRLVVTDGPAWHLGDTFLNGAKEADYVRYGSAKQIMSLSKANTEALWDAVQDNDYAAFARVNNSLLNAAMPLKHIPLRLYIPDAPAKGSTPAAYRVMQARISPRSNSHQPQTLGPALRQLLPQLFPSSRDPVLAQVILHGAPVPFRAPLEELMREAAYPDGWLCMVVVLL